MSNVTVGKVFRDGKGKKSLQACELGGSIYGKASSVLGTPARTQEGSNDLTSNYKNFYRSQVDIMNKVFGKKAK